MTSVTGSGSRFARHDRAIEALLAGGGGDAAAAYAELVAAGDELRREYLHPDYWGQDHPRGQLQR